MKVGQKVIANGYEGTVIRVLDGQLKGMIEVRLSSGVICIDASEVDTIVGTGQLVNKLENAIALAIVRGDTAAERRFIRALELAVNSTDFPKVSA